MKQVSGYLYFGDIKLILLEAFICAHMV